MLNFIDTDSKNKIQSSQVILDLQGLSLCSHRTPHSLILGAVKELVENSLDAGSTTIEVSFNNFGFNELKVIDNGNGIDDASFSTLTKKHFTSKLSHFDDLCNLSSFGFRGEALSSLCSVSKTLDCLTATQATSPKATKVSFDNKGDIVDLKQNIPRQKGTTFSLSTLFHNLPVRRREFEKNLKREYSKAINLMQSYALCPLHTNIKFIVTNINKANKKSVIFQTTGNNSLASSIASVFGSSANQSLIPLSLDLPVEIDSALANRENVDTTSFTVYLNGSISKPLLGHGRSTSDRQYFYVNGRPCVLPKVAKSINLIFKSFNNQAFPFIVADFKIPTDAYDVNITPDKRTIFLHFESSLIDSLKYHLNSFFEPFRGHFAINKPTPILTQSFVHKASIDTQDSGPTPQDKSHESESRTAMANERVEEESNSRHNEVLQQEYKISNIGLEASDVTQNISVVEKVGDAVEKASEIDEEASDISDQKEEPQGSSQINTRHASWASEVFSGVDEVDRHMPKRRRTETELEVCVDGEETANDPESGSFKTQKLNDHDETRTHEAMQVDSSNNNDTPAINDISSDDEPNFFKQSLSIDIDHLRQHWQSKVRPKNTADLQPTIETDLKGLDNAGLENTENFEAAEQALSRLLHKSDFENLQVIGQFNLGFLIVKRSAINIIGREENDLFIVDQHAADEKYNFETLQLTSRIQTQKLIRWDTMYFTAYTYISLDLVHSI